MNHKHNYEIAYVDRRPDGSYLITKVCKCGQKHSDVSQTGDWIRA